MHSRQGIMYLWGSNVLVSELSLFYTASFQLQIFLFKKLTHSNLALSILIVST